MASRTPSYTWPVSSSHNHPHFITSSSRRVEHLCKAQKSLKNENGESLAIPHFLTLFTPWWRSSSAAIGTHRKSGVMV
ncbi:MAG TPA: hypothetical protein VKV79_02860 [Terriglobia bacterium]|nr:hypothetical protein [Terriglobia bacterium]